MTTRKYKQKQGMVDISQKNITQRAAVASSQITMSLKAFKSLMNEESPKGDVLETAKVAGIMAAKSTPAIIPLCHPLQLNKVKITFVVDKAKCIITSTAQVKCLGRTGVEMEALCAASIASLTIYDMMKWADKDMVISQTKLLQKTGGKSGPYKRKNS